MTFGDNHKADDLMDIPDEHHDTDSEIATDEEADQPLRPFQPPPRRYAPSTAMIRVEAIVKGQTQQRKQQNGRKRSKLERALGRNIATHVHP